MNKDPLKQSLSQQQGTHFKSKLTLLQDVEQFTKDSFESNILVWPIRTDHENKPIKQRWAKRGKTLSNQNGRKELNKPIW